MEMTKPTLDPDLTKFCASPAAEKLRVCCYGSSSDETPLPYKHESWKLGYILAKRGHSCVNGAGSYGCMAAINDGASEGNGHIVGVIHEKFIVDGSDWRNNNSQPDGAHAVFSLKGGNGAQQKQQNGGGPKREILVASGSNLQERKRLLVEGADALIVMPGGPGTWDELWEMACGKNLGWTSIPICIVNVNGYYDDFLNMLKRAYKEKLVKTPPEELLHFSDSALEAIQFIEESCNQQRQQKKPSETPLLKRRTPAMRENNDMLPATIYYHPWVMFLAGVALGAALVTVKNGRK